jgi:hypothetical protein
MKDLYGTDRGRRIAGFEQNYRDVEHRVTGCRV